MKVNSLLEYDCGKMTDTLGEILEPVNLLLYLQVILLFHLYVNCFLVRHWKTLPRVTCLIYWSVYGL